jgi:hypothetical protein
MLFKTKKIPSDYTELEELNPGQELRDQFIEIFPKKKFVAEMDESLMANGDFEDLLYRSSINYLIRRFITAARYIHDKYYKSHGDARVRTEIRKYLSDYTRLKDAEKNLVINILIKCIDTADDDFNDSEKHTVKRQIAEYEWGCYICGKELNMEKNSNDSNAGTADHKWPKSLGGLSELGNLRYACKECNNKYKKDFIDYSDYHYEEIAMIISSYSEYVSKIQPNKKGYEAAIFSKSDYKCEICSQPAYRVGELFIGRRDIEDTWHYLNLTTYCNEHTPE